MAIYLFKQFFLMKLEKGSFSNVLIVILKQGSLRFLGSMHHFRVKKTGVSVFLRINEKLEDRLSSTSLKKLLTFIYHWDQTECCAYAFLGLSV